MNVRKQTNLRRNQQQKAAVTVPATERGRDPPLRGVDAQLRKNYPAGAAAGVHDAARRGCFGVAALAIF
jgi:hypothetical protein